MIGGIISRDFLKINYAMKLWIYLFWILNLNDRIEELILIVRGLASFLKTKIIIKYLNYENEKLDN